MPFPSLHRQAVLGGDVASMFADSKGLVWMNIDKVFLTLTGSMLSLKKPDGAVFARVDW
jgi:hypothetical protein